MNDKRLELAVRHGALRARIAQQRADFSHQAAPLAALLAQGDSALRGADWLKHHPAAIVAAVAAVVVARPSRAWRWAKRGLFVWRGWQTLRQRLNGRT